MIRAQTRARDPAVKSGPHQRPRQRLADRAHILLKRKLNMVFKLIIRITCLAGCAMHFGPRNGCSLSYVGPLRTKNRPDRENQVDTTGGAVISRSTVIARLCNGVAHFVALVRTYKRLVNLV